MKLHSALAVLLVPLLFAGNVRAQSDDSALRSQLRQVTLQLRQAQDDQATLQAQKTAAETERDAVKKQLAALQGELARARHEGVRADAAQQELARTKSALTQATDKAADSARQTQAEQDKLQTTVTNTQTLLTACESKNTQLLAVGREILSAYEKFDVGDAIGANEPFTQLKRVELENLAQGYEDRIGDGRYDPRAVHPAQAKPAADKPSGTSP